MASKGFGSKGSGKTYGLKHRLKAWNDLVDGKTKTRVDMIRENSIILHRPGCDAVRYHKPGSNKK